VDANLRASESPTAVGQVMNCGVGRRITLNALLAEMQKALGTNLPPEYREMRAGDVRHSLADISRAQKLLGYEPSVHLPEGLQRTVTWYKENLDRL
jgi:nucleoside-diphosphate-sugar epimerase